MARNEVRIHASTKDDASKPLDNIRDKVTKLQSVGGKGLAIGAVAGATAAGLNLVASAAGEAATAVVGFVEDSITKASDLNETMSKAEVIFGDNSKAVEDWAATMDRSAGESKKDALDAASGFAGLFKTVGLGIDESTQKSEKLTQLGADLASFFNTDVGTALDALKSGLNGESEPLRQFNIFLSETAVAGELAKEGVKKVNGQFTEAQKATARYNLILQQTGDAQGDFARTSDGLANSQRVTAAEVDNLQAEIGQELLPVVRDLSNWAKDDGVPAIKELVGAIKEAEPAFGVLGTVIGMVNSNGKSGQQVGRDLAESWFGVSDAANAASDSFVWVPTATRDMDKLEPSMVAAYAATLDLDGATTDLHHSYAPVITDLRTIKQKFDDATQSIEDQMFAEGDLTRALKEHHNALQEDIASLHQLEKIKHPTAEQRDDILRTKDAISEDKKGVIEATIKLHEMGKITFAQLVKQLRSIGFNLMADTDAAKELRRALMAADQAAGGRAGHGGGGGSGLPGVTGHSAAGGFTPAGGKTWVGEGGKAEMAYALPGGGIMVDPHPAGAAMFSPSSVGYAGNGAAPAMGSTQPLIIQVVLDGRVIAEATAPHVTKWQQARGL